MSGIFLKYSHLPCGPAMLSRRKLSGDPPETLPGGSPDFLAKSLVIPAIYMKFKLKFVSDKLEFHIPYTRHHKPLLIRSRS